MTSLSQQLQRLALPDGSFGRSLDNRRPSLLFDSKEAVLFDQDTIYGLGVDGFEELCQLDGDLHDLYHNHLFSEKARDCERTVKTKEFNQMLDLTINKFLMHISQYFLLRPAQKCLEWLIYRFHIHSYNVEGMLRCILPFHGSNMFLRASRVVQPQEKSVKLNWLKLIQEQEEAISTLKIASLCAKDSSFFGFVCDMMQDIIKEFLSKSSSTRISVNHHVAFFTATMLGTIQYAKRISDGTLTKMIPLLLKAFQTQHPDFQASFLMVFSQLVTSVTLKAKVLHSTVSHCLKYCLPQFEVNLVRLTLLLYETQQQIGVMSLSTLRKFYLLKDFYKAVHSFGERCQKFVLMIFRIELSALIDSNEERPKANHILRLVQEVTFSQSTQKSCLNLLMHSVFSDDLKKLCPERTKMATDTLVLMQNKYSQEFDACLDVEFDAEFCSTRGMSKFLESAYKGSTSSLAIGLLHPSPSIRTQVLAIISDLLGSSEDPESVIALVKKHIHQMLSSDTNNKVIQHCIKFLQEHDTLLMSSTELIDDLFKLIFSSGSSLACGKDLFKFILTFDFASVCPSDQGINYNNLKILCLFKLQLDSLKSKDLEKLLASISKLPHLMNKSNMSFPDTKDPEKVVESFLQTLSTLSTGNITFLLNYVSQNLNAKNEDSSFLHSPFVWLLTLALVENSDLSNQDLPFKMIYSFVLKEIGFQLSNASSKPPSQTLGLVSLLTNLFVQPRDSFALVFCLDFAKQLLAVAGKLDSSSASEEDQFNLNLQTLSFVIELFKLIESSPECRDFKDELVKSVGGVFQVFCQSFFDDMNLLIEFLLSVWKRSVDTIGIQSISLMLILLKNESSQKDLDVKRLIPSLLLVCCSPDIKARIIALQCLAAIPSTTNQYFKLAHFICHSSDEIKTDPNSLGQCMKAYFQTDGQSQKKVAKERQAFLKSLMETHVLSDISKSRISDFSLDFLTKCCSEVNLNTVFQLLLSAANKLMKNHNDMCSNEHHFVGFLLGKAVSLKPASKHLGSLFCNVLSLESSCQQYKDGKNYSAQQDALALLSKKRFSSFSMKEKQEIFHLLIKLKTSANHELLTPQVNKVLKAIPISSVWVVSELKLCNFTTEHGKSLKEMTGKQTKQAEPDVNSLQAILETLQHKKQIDKPQDLLEMVCELLNVVVSSNSLTEQADYLSLLLISGLLNLLKRIQSSEMDEKVRLQVERTLKIETVVHCIQQTENSLVHREAILLLAESVQFFPEKIVHTVMSIFTFMGNSLLRKDDSYSFQVISQTIHSVVPALLLHKKKVISSEDSVVGILQVFVDAMSHIPTHRRLTVLKELLQAVGPKEYVWKIAILLLHSHFCTPKHSDKEEKMETNEEAIDHPGVISLEEMIDLCQSICHLFSLDHQTHTIEEILSYLKFLPNEFDRENKKDSCHNRSLINCDKMTSIQICNLRLGSILLASRLLSNSGPLNQCFQTLSESADDFAMVFMRRAENFERVLLNALQLNEIVTELRSRSVSFEKVTRYYDVLQAKMNEVLDKINLLLPTGTMLLIVSKLLEEQFRQCHLKVIQIFTKHVSHGYKFSENEATLFQNIAEHLVKLLQNNSGNSEASDRVAAATALIRIVKISGTSCAGFFVSLVPSLCQFVTEYKELDSEVLAASILCLGELLVTLKAYCIGHLSVICPSLMSLLSAKKILRSPQLLHSSVKATYQLLMSVPNFLSPYVVGFLSKLAPVTLLYDSKPGEVDESDHSRPPKRRKDKSASSQGLPRQISSTLDAILNVVGRKIPSRVLIPALSASYKKVLLKCPTANKYLVQLSNLHLSSLGKAMLNAHSNAMFGLLMEMAEFRESCQEASFDEVLDIEKPVLEGLVSLCLKLPEEEFQVVFHKLSAWGSSEESGLCRSATFYHCANILASKLKGIFSPFANDLVTNFAALVQDGVPDKDEILARTRIFRVKNATQIFITLLQSDETFVTQDKFDQICEPLVNELQRTYPSSHQTAAADYVSNHVIPLIAYLAAASHNRVAWQPLHHGVLMKMRHGRSGVRILALDATLAIAEKLGQDYMALIPDTVPFLAELMEDEDNEVEQHCHRTTTKLESLLGESLQKFF